MAVIKFKGTDGLWHMLSNIMVKGINVVQTSGTSSGDVMSQKAVTEITSGINESLTSHTSNTDIHLTQTEKRDIDAIDTNISVLSAITSENISAWNNKQDTSGMTAYTLTSTTDTISGTVTAHTSDTTSHLTSNEKSDLHGHTNKTYLDTVSGSVGTMAYENANSYSSATEVSTALNGKSNTGHVHTADEVTAMTNYTSAVTISPITVNDTLNTAIGKLERSFGGVKIVTISQSDYDALVDAGTVDATTLYVVTED